MRRGVLMTVLAAALTAAAALVPVAGAGARTLLSVRPGTGTATSTFVIRFRHPDQTGLAVGVRRIDRLSVKGPGAGPRCASRLTRDLAPAAQGHISTVRLRPRLRGGRWCTGRYSGSIRETSTVVCGLHPLCPIPAPLTRTITRFSFRVRRPGRQGSGRGSQTGGPTFAGITAATTCIVLTPHPSLAPLRPYHLSWNAATDPTTPSSAIVYDIYYSPTSGAEDYSHPTWTTAPGATAYTAGVAPGPAYFVVRARDQAGHEDDNTVERQGVSICG